MTSAKECVTTQLPNVSVLKMDDTKMNKSFPCPVCYEFKNSAYRVGGRRIIIEDLL